jgi:NAD(P)-dependent dehydrogenase (short-subunit alcohol dehydrogenase family)
MIGRMNTDLTGHVAIITGAASPPGAAAARTLAAAGARVALVDLNPDRIAALAAEIRAAGGQAIDIAADVASKFQCVTVVETTRAEWGRLDILVNATIVRPSVSLIKMDEWEWARCLDVNLKGTFLMCQLVGRVIADENGNRGGTILILAEGAAGASNVAYAASMAGLTGFAAACAAEYRPLGIHVHLLPPLDAAADLGAAVVALIGGTTQPGD